MPNSNVGRFQLNLFVRDSRHKEHERSEEGEVGFAADAGAMGITPEGTGDVASHQIAVGDVR